MHSPSPSPPPTIRASEIGQYVFCQRAWWLGSVEGYRPVNEEALRAGTKAHRQHGRSAAASQRWQRVGYALLVVGAFFFALALCGVLGAGL